ncbi:MAG: hypothetical protein ACRDJC_18705, partial [Thermomicrobiales bacterium]
PWRMGLHGTEPLHFGRASCRVVRSIEAHPGAMAMPSGTASLFDLDGTLVDSLNQHVVAE